MGVNYCKRCGRTYSNELDEEGARCDVCDALMYWVPAEFLNEEMGFIFKSPEVKQQFIDTYIKTSPELDPYLFEHREEILARESAQIEAALEHGKALRGQGVKCAYCGSVNVKKISWFERALSAQIWGLASSKIGKQWHCN
ncbi:MAG: hypothetical protein K2O06_18440, partial [Acetatifactor sp.]|nr:hypothetical protein [Acetatifactor sp.]